LGTPDTDTDALRREYDYMDSLLSKVKDLLKIDQQAGLMDLEIYLTRLMNN
jgi:hypothetical protein